MIATGNMNYKNITVGEVITFFARGNVIVGERMTRYCIRNGVEPNENSMVRHNYYYRYRVEEL